MTDPTPNPAHSTGNPGHTPLSPGQWIRAAADGQTDGFLPPAELPPDADARIAFDRELRAACSRTQAKVLCPDAVRARILASIAAEPATHLESSGVIRTPMGDTRSQSFWSGLARVGALAAVLALGATVVYKGMSAGGPSHAMPVHQASILASFVEERHSSCPKDESELQQRFAVHSIDDARTVCSAQLDDLPPAFCESIKAMRADGFDFVGISTCNVPDQGAAVHLMFQAVNELKPARVSMFIQRDTQGLNIKASACYLTGCPKHGQLVAWRTDGFVNYLYACTPESLAAARASLSVPASEKPL